MLVVLADPHQRIFDYDETVDAHRLDQLAKAINVEPFDLGSSNHRSPNSGILAFADAVLNSQPLPATDKVHLLSYQSNEFASKLHAVVAHLVSVLQTEGIERPTVALLCRANNLIPSLSSALSSEHTWANQPLAPIEHDVEWDPEMSAAAARVVATILEWTLQDPEEEAAVTCEEISNYFRLKHAKRTNNSALQRSDKLIRAAKALREGKMPRSKAGRHLRDSASSGLQFSGRPVEDWLLARSVLEHIEDLKEIFANVRFVRMFKATDQIATLLSDLWSHHLSYSGAHQRIGRVLDIGTLE